MSDTVYKDLITALGMRGGAAPTLECPEMYALLEELFTPEEAGLAGQMPMGAVSTADLASSTGRDAAEVERLIDGMCNKGLVIGRPRGGVEVYSLLQILPGIFEYQFMKGEVNDRTRKRLNAINSFNDGFMNLGLDQHLPVEMRLNHLLELGNYYAKICKTNSLEL